MRRIRPSHACVLTKRALVAMLVFTTMLSSLGASDTESGDSTKPKFTMKWQEYKKMRKPDYTEPVKTNEDVKREWSEKEEKWSDYGGRFQELMMGHAFYVEMHTVGTFMRLAPEDVPLGFGHVATFVSDYFPGKDGLTVKGVQSFQSDRLQPVAQLERLGARVAAHVQMMLRQYYSLQMELYETEDELRQARKELRVLEEKDSGKDRYGRLASGEAFEPFGFGHSQLKQRLDDLRRRHEEILSELPEQWDGETHVGDLAVAIPGLSKEVLLESGMDQMFTFGLPTEQQVAPGGSNLFVDMDDYWRTAVLLERVEREYPALAERPEDLSDEEISELPVIELVVRGVDFSKVLPKSKLPLSSKLPSGRVLEVGCLWSSRVPVDLPKYFTELRAVRRFASLVRVYNYRWQGIRRTVEFRRARFKSSQQPQPELVSTKESVTGGLVAWSEFGRGLQFSLVVPKHKAREGTMQDSPSTNRARGDQVEDAEDQVEDAEDQVEDADEEVEDADDQVEDNQDQEDEEVEDSESDCGSNSSESSYAANSIDSIQWRRPEGQVDEDDSEVDENDSLADIRDRQVDDEESQIDEEESQVDDETSQVDDEESQVDEEESLGEEEDDDLAYGIHLPPSPVDVIVGPAIRSPDLLWTLDYLGYSQTGQIDKNAENDGDVELVDNDDLVDLSDVDTWESIEGEPVMISQLRSSRFRSQDVLIEMKQATRILSSIGLAIEKPRTHALPQSIHVRLRSANGDPLKTLHLVSKYKTASELLAPIPSECDDSEDEDDGDDDDHDEGDEMQSQNENDESESDEESDS